MDPPDTERNKSASAEIIAVLSNLQFREDFEDFDDLRLLSMEPSFSSMLTDRIYT